MTTVRTYPIAVSVHPTREALGLAAGALAARHLRVALEQHPHATVMLAAAPSQAATLAALATEPDVEWSRVSAFHMDEYLGLDPEAPQGFGNWLERTFVSRVPSLTFNRMRRRRRSSGRRRGVCVPTARGSVRRGPAGARGQRPPGLQRSTGPVRRPPGHPRGRAGRPVPPAAGRRGPLRHNGGRAAPSHHSHHPATPAGRAHRGVGSRGGETRGGPSHPHRCDRAEPPRHRPGGCHG